MSENETINHQQAFQFSFIRKKKNLGNDHRAPWDTLNEVLQRW